jgi:putative peptidoglycan lipid II flippase
MSLLKSSAIFAIFTFISRIMGFIRDVLMASVLGAGFISDCFFVAFKLPNFFRRLFAEGAFSASFVPHFNDHLHKEGKQQALKFAEESFAFLLIILLAFVALVEIFTPAFLYVVAAGFTEDEAKYQLAVTLTRFTFPYILFVSLMSLFAGILNSLGRFAATAFLPIVLNICLISALAGAAEWMDTPAHTLAIAVSLAGVIQLLILYIACAKVGYVVKLRLPRLTPRVKELLKTMAPAAIGAGVIQVNLLIDVILATTLGQGAVSYLFYADRLNQLPVGVIGVALGTVLLPYLSKKIAEGKMDEVIHSQNRAIEMGLFLTIPAAVAFVIVPYELIHALYERGEFGAEQAGATSAALAAYAFGLPAYILAKVFTPGYFARKDTKTPMKFALYALGVNLVLNLILMQYFAHVGLAIATSISAWVNVLMLSTGLIRRGHYRFDNRVIGRIIRYIICSIIMGFTVHYVAINITDITSASGFEVVKGIVILVAVGIISYIVSAFGIGAAKLSEVKSIFLRKAKS